MLTIVLLGRAVSRSTILDGKTGHGYAIGSLDLSNHTVGGDVGRESGNECELL